jgi:hypothetical protein
MINRLKSALSMGKARSPVARAQASGSCRVEIESISGVNPFLGQHLIDVSQEEVALSLGGVGYA